ncbi:MAG: RES family NAD+ phosphorylase [Xanthobacteraceae bacterium]|nr:RES family NAD+ phosphorylase [Xanthobacteraceae bacterium]
MSSSTWTRDALSSESRPVTGRCWRLVEAQHHVSTVKLTDNQEEQERLEQLLEETKPAIPAECIHLRYLLFTPFRYGAPYPRGSRFRRAGFTQGVFYGAELPRTAAIEVAFYRLLFFAESPATPWPANPGEYTAFAVDYATGRAIDLRTPPLDRDRTRWIHPTDYAGCQALAGECREAGIDVIKYQSVRDPEPATNVAILHCRAFASADAVERQTWRIQVSATGARLLCEAPKASYGFDRAAFANDPRIKAMQWER